MGKHLLVDAFGITNDIALSELDFNYTFLESIPGLVGLTALGNPTVVKATDKSADGITGFQLLTTSHASIHTWSNGPKMGQAQLDVYSCDDFDEAKVMREFKKLYSPKKIKHSVKRRA